jgi:hypothetical protein
MLVYVLYGALSSVASILHFVRGRSIKKIAQYFYVNLSIFLIIFAAFRYKTGYDYEGYGEIFYFIQNGADYYDVLIEPGFWLFFYLLKSLRFEIAFAVVTAVSIGIKLYVIKKWSPLPLLSLLLYFSITYLEKDFGQVRQGMSMALFLLSAYLMGKQEKLYSYLSWILSIGMHYSALIALPTLILFRYQFKKRTLYLLILIGFILSILDINNLATPIYSVFPDIHIGIKVYSHISDNNLNNQALGLNLSLLLRVFLCFLLINCSSEICKYYPYFGRFLVNSYVYGLFIYLLFNSNSEFAIRLSAYFKMLDFLIFPILISILKTPLYRFLMYLIAVFYSIYSIAKLLYHPDLGWNFIPYQNWLFTN